MSTKRSVVSGLFWRFGERVGAQLVSFIVSIILARILAPSDYGVIAMVNVFIAFADVIVVNGFGSALIQKKNADNVDFSTVFYFQIFLAGVVYLALFFSAPLISDFYGSDYTLLTPILRVLGLRLFLTALNNIQAAYVSKHMMFRKFFFATLGGTIISAFVGIALAYSGAGAWALVAQYLTNSLIDSLILFITVKWRPVFAFSVKRLKALFSYGWKLLISALLDTGYNQLKNLMIGKIYNSSDLAYYNKGTSYPQLIVSNINSSIDSVLFPVISAVQDDKEAIKNMARRSIKTSSYLMFPLMMGLAVVAKPLIALMLTEKWLPCVPYVQIFCFVYAFMPVHTSNLQAIKAIGRSDIFLRLEIIKKVVGLSVMIFSIRYGVFWFAFSSVFTTVFSSIVNAFPNKKLINYSYFQQLKDLAPATLLSVIMGAVVYLFNFLSVPDIVKLIIQVPVGGVIYIGLSWLLKIDSFSFLLKTVKEIIFKRKKKDV